MTITKLFPAFSDMASTIFDQSKVSSAKLPHTGSAKFSKKQTVHLLTFGATAWHSQESTITAREPANWWVTSVERLPNCQNYWLKNSINQNYWLKKLYTFNIKLLRLCKLDIDRGFLLKRFMALHTDLNPISRQG